MNEIIHKNVKRFLAGIGTLLLCFSSVTIPCFADTTYYSYNYYSLADDGKIFGINLNVSSIHPVVFSVNYDGNVSYYLYYVLYAGGFSSSTEAQSYGQLYATLSGIPKSISNEGSANWTYGNTLNGNINVGSYVNSSGTTVYYYISAIGVGGSNSSGYSYFENTGVTTGTYAGVTGRGKGVYCFNNTDLFTYIGGSKLRTTTVIENYAKFKIAGDLANNFTIGTVPAKTWLKNSETLIPVIDVNDLPSGDGDISDSGGNAGPSATSDPESGGSSGSGSSSSGSMSQTQSIASGAVAFTVEDGAFSQTQTQTIESDAVNVTVTNNNELTNENLNHINQIINNNPETTENTFQDAIANMNQFRAMAAAFAALAGVVLGWLPSWVTGLIGLSFSILSVMIIFRLIHLFV